MGKKRKKKVYNTPKKIKHTHVSKKLNIINIINNNPRCLNCNHCLAVHFDRFSCSYCNNSFDIV